MPATQIAEAPEDEPALGRSAVRRVTGAEAATIQLDSSPDRADVRTPSAVSPMPSFEQLYDAHVDLVWRALHRLGVAPSAIEDAVQEVFIVVFKKLETFEGRSAVSTWLYGICAHVARNARRTTRRHPETPTDDARILDSRQDTKTPDESMEDAEASAVLYAILDELDDDKREAFVLCELEQLSAPDIAASLALNVNTVYARVRAARAAFDQAVARYRAKNERRSASCR